MCYVLRSANTALEIGQEAGGDRNGGRTVAAEQAGDGVAAALESGSERGGGAARVRVAAIGQPAARRPSTLFFEPSVPPTVDQRCVHFCRLNNTFHHTIVQTVSKSK